MIKTLAYHKAEPTVLSNHAVNCHNTTMNEVHFVNVVKGRAPDGAPIVV